VKRIGTKMWLAREALSQLPADVRAQVRALARDEGFEYDLVRYDRKDGSIMLGEVPDLGGEPVPELVRSLLWKPGREPKVTVYRDPPVYHRTEQMLPKGDPRTPKLAAASKKLEAAGLLSRPDIGRRSSWAKAKKAKGRAARAPEAMNPVWTPLVLGAVADEFRVTVADLVGPSRRQRIVRARYAAVAVLWTCGFSKQEIASFLNRDRGTIVYALESAWARAEKHGGYRAQLDRLGTLGKRICRAPGRGRRANRMDAPVDVVLVRPAKGTCPFVLRDDWRVRLAAAAATAGLNNTWAGMLEDLVAREGIEVQGDDPYFTAPGGGSLSRAMWEVISDKNDQFSATLSPVWASEREQAWLQQRAPQMGYAHYFWDNYWPAFSDGHLRFTWEAWMDECLDRTRPRRRRLRQPSCRRDPARYLRAAVAEERQRRRSGEGGRGETVLCLWIPARNAGVPCDPYVLASINIERGS
jgi:hypothetical protein